jgi:2-hydroxy-4-carboxymuconate semialdehyde hemiacetal dehydrogenase
MKICVAGEGAFGGIHLQSLACLDGVEVASLAGGVPAATQELASRWRIPHWSTSLDECLAQPGIEAVILATPTPLHAEQAVRCLRAGKHVVVEIPMADSLHDAERVVRAQKESGRIAMVGHTYRFTPGHRWLRGRFASGELRLQQLHVQTWFMRRTNLNMFGQPRSWTDHLLWHHACHTVDLFHYMTGESASEACALQGPAHPALGIAMDMSISLKTPSGVLCSLSLSFNNDGPLGSSFRFICDKGTFVSRQREFRDGRGEPIDLGGLEGPASPVEALQREFVAAIREGREPNASVTQCFDAMQTLDRIEAQLVSRPACKAATA